MNRREFLALTSVAAAGAGCNSVEQPGGVSNAGPRLVNAGPAGKYAADGVYSGFRDVGFFVIRKGEKLSACSSYCTHRRCKLTAEPDRTFYCQCHGSTFDPAGKVTAGPARRDLPEYPVTVDEHGQLLVEISGG